MDAGNGEDTQVFLDLHLSAGFQPMEGFGGMPGSFCYPTGFMKGLLWAAEKELGKR